MRMHVIMPIQMSSTMQQQIRQGRNVVRTLSVPMKMFDDRAETRCRHYHDESLDQIAAKGGFDAIEACAVLGILDTSTRGTVMSELTAHRVLAVCMQLFHRSPDV